MHEGRGRVMGAGEACLKLAMPALAVFALMGPGSAFGEAGHPQGVWGTAPACDAWRAGDEPRAELQLYEIGEQWIRRHVFFCMVRPQMSVRTPDGRWLMDIVCGEDARQVGR